MWIEEIVKFEWGDKPLISIVRTKENEESWTWAGVFEYFWDQKSVMISAVWRKPTDEERWLLKSFLESQGIRKPIWDRRTGHSVRTTNIQFGGKHHE